MLTTEQIFTDSKSSLSLTTEKEFENIISEFENIPSVVNDITKNVKDLFSPIFERLYKKLCPSFLDQDDLDNNNHTYMIHVIYNYFI